MIPQSLPTEPEIDPKENPYIRTYAKDYAQLSGKGTSALSKTAPEKSSRLSTSLFGRKDTDAPAPPAGDESLITHDENDGIVTPELSELEHEAELRDAQVTEEQKEVTEELSALKKSQSDEVDLPPIQPASPPQGSNIVSTKADPADKTRESLLQRLRTRAESKNSLSSPTLQPILPHKLEADLPSPEPETAPAPEPAPIPIPAPIPTPIPVAPSSETPTPFHSFSTDFADRVDEQYASTFSVLAAEKDAALQTPRAPRKNHYILPIAAGIILILAGGAAIAVAYQYTREHAPVQLMPTVPSLITPDATAVLRGTDLSQSLAQEATRPLAQEDVLVTYITNSTTTSSGIVQVPQPGGALITALGLNAPDILMRNIDPSSTVGIIHAGSETRPFFLLKVDSYDRTFEGMLDWEATMPQDLALFYPAYANAPAPTVSSSTATSTLATTTPAPIPVQSSPRFVDGLVASHSVRMLQDSQGRTLLLYGYTADKQVLIIARDEAAFTLLLSRLSSSGN